MNASAGRVLILPKGEYNPATTYNMLDMVRYQNGTFVCKQTSTGNAPSFDADTDYWQLLVSGSDVTGVKGDAEATYREGNVNITKANIGLGNVDNTSDADKPVSTAQQTALNGKLGTSGAATNTTVAYTTKDAAKTTTEKTNSTTDQPSTVEKLTSGETLATMFGKISAMFKNVRRLWNTVGTTAIDTAYGATVTAQLSSLKSYNTYSTSEAWTGEYWTDGKKIYKKTISVGSQSAANAAIEIALSLNIDTPIGAEGYGIYNSSHKITYPACTTSSYAGFHFQENKLYFGSHSYTNLHTSIKATIYYTKTTD